MSTTPKAALAAIAGAREAVAEAIATRDPDAIVEALTRLKGHCDVLDLEAPADADDTEAWQEVADALHDLMAWLEEPAPAAKAAMTREQKVKLAVAIASRGRRRGNAGRQATDAILDTFYGGVGLILKASWKALKLAVRGLVAAGEVVGRGVHAGAVQVDEYIRNGRRVRAYSRNAPGKAVGAHLLYR